MQSSGIFNLRLLFYKTIKLPPWPLLKGVFGKKKEREVGLP